VDVHGHQGVKFRNKDRLTAKIRQISPRTRAEVRQALRRGGLLIENHAVASIIEQTPGGRPYRSRGAKNKIHYASPPGAAPNADTGELHQSITSVVALDSPALIQVDTGANAPYAEALEFGTSKMAPRPFMAPAFNANRAAIRQMVQQAVIRAARSVK